MYRLKYLVVTPPHFRALVALYTACVALYRQMPRRVPSPISSTPPLVNESLTLSRVLTCGPCLCRPRYPPSRIAPSFSSLRSHATVHCAAAGRGRFQVGQIGDHSAVLELHSKRWTGP